MEGVQGFGYKSTWVAAKGTPSATLAAVLGVYDAQPSSWTGVDKVYGSPLDAERHPVFITPPLDGWTLAVSKEFQSLGAQGGIELACSLSDRLQTDVQVFSTHRVSDTHSWIWAHKKNVLRAYACDSCRKVLNEGPLTSQEKELGLDFAALEDEETGVVPDEGTVMDLAAIWSINPSMLATTHPDAPDGLLGSLINTNPFSVAEFVIGLKRKPWWKFW